MKLARSSPTKAIAGIAIISAGGRSPTEGERPTTGSDEGNPSWNELWNSYPVLSNPKGAPTKLGEVQFLQKVECGEESILNSPPQGSSE